MPAKAASIGLTVMFFGSGALALVYEGVWQRQFALVLGSAAPATAAVLAAYFAGLAAGSLALGSLSKRWSRPLRVYAVLEIGVGAGALLAAPMLAGIDGMHPWFFERYSASPALFFCAKTLLAFLAIFVPTFCMGGTLPILGQFVDQGRRRLGVTAGMLYSANTAGAGLGALAFPFLLLPLLGNQGTVWFCVSGNYLVAAAAWGMDRGPVATNAALSRPPPKPTRNQEKPIWKWTVLFLALLSGVATFVLQVLWNRAFAQVHENAMHSFAVIVAMFVFALALGAELARMGLRRGMAAGSLLGWCWIAGGLFVAVSPWIFMRFTGGLEYLGTGAGWMQDAPRLIGLAAAVVFVPVTLLGIGFPAILEQGGRSLPPGAGAGALIGRVLAVNLAGSVGGAVLAGFVLPGWLGLWGGIMLTAVVLIVAGAWQIVPAGSKSRGWNGRIALIAVLTAGVWLSAKVHWPRVRVEGLDGERLIEIAEGSHGISAVVERADSRRLKLNNHYVLGGTAASGDERVQAHLPLLYHPSPRRVALLGFGTGITASGAVFHPVETIKAVELVPEVVMLARRHFREANAEIIENTKMRLVVEDARSYMRSTTEQFDVIVGDLIVPWRQGEGALLTLDHFVSTRRALAPGGLFCQWLPMFQLSETELRIVLRTFLSVFPAATVWRGDFSPDEPAVALMGSVPPFEIEPATVRRRLGEMLPDPFNAHLKEPAAFWMHYVGRIELADLPDVELRVHSEDRPWIELLGPMRRTGQREALLCTGRRLQTWFDEVSSRSAERDAALGDEGKAGIRAGQLMFEFTLSSSEGNEARAIGARNQLRAVLPPDTFGSLFQP